MFPPPENILSSRKAKRRNRSAAQTATAEQIENAQLSGWCYLGDGIFVKGDKIGHFVREGDRVVFRAQ